MSILLALALQTALRGGITVSVEAHPTPVPTREAGGGELVVTAPHVYRARAVSRIDRRSGRRGCTVRRSFGVPSLDAALCDATLACAAIAATRPAVRECVLPRIMAAIVPHERIRRTRG